MRWPIGINEDMDRHAAIHDLPHWSCVSPNSNEFWLRRDGLTYVFNEPRRSYVDCLRKQDIEYRRGEDFAKFETMTAREPRPIDQADTRRRVLATLCLSLNEVDTTKTLNVFGVNEHDLAEIAGQLRYEFDIQTIELRLDMKVDDLIRQIVEVLA